MYIRRRIKQYQQIGNGVTWTDKAKLFLLALFFTLPNKITNMNAQTPQFMIDLTKNLRVNYNDRIYKLSHPRQIFMITDQYERNIRHWFDMTGDTFLDVGANIGKYSLMLCNRFRDVHSFEPTPETNMILYHNVLVNGIRNIQIYSKAAWNKAETLTFYLKNNPEGNSATFQTEKAVKTLKVEAIQLDSLIEFFGKVDLVKIDVEGAEPEALQGMTEIIRRDKPVMIVEILESNEQTVYGFMESMGYALVEKQNRNHLFKPVKRDSS